MAKLIPKFKGIIKDGKIKFYTESFFNNYIQELEGKKVSIIVKRFSKQRSGQQNKSIHLWFAQLAEALNKDGFDMRAIIKDGVDIFWSAYTVKEHLWRPVQKAYLGKESTTELTTDEIDKIFDIINKVIGEKTGIYVPFPSIETLMEQKMI